MYFNITNLPTNFVLLSISALASYRPLVTFFIDYFPFVRSLVRCRSIFLANLTNYIDCLKISPQLFFVAIF